MRKEILSRGAWIALIEFKTAIKERRLRDACVAWGRFKRLKTAIG